MAHPASLTRPAPSRSSASSTRETSGVVDYNPSATKQNATPIVMINPEKDNDTGAQKATEVDSASNVVVGG
jgi:hypothetical protein